MDLRLALNNAVLALLRPLVRVLLRHGLAYDDFAELARRTYVDVAERDFALKGRKQTTSRISVITGLNRKEVARLQALNAQPDAGSASLAQTMNRAAKVVAGWMQEHAAPGARAAEPGAPAASTTEPLTPEQFAALVRRHSGDMPARAVLDELRHAGALNDSADGRLQLAPQGYVPQATDARKIGLLGQHAAELLGSIDHNLSHPPEQGWLQQRVFAEHIPADRIDAVRARLREAGQQALAETRSTLIEHDAGDLEPAPGARRVTLGVYYFEAPAEAAPNILGSAPVVPPVAAGASAALHTTPSSPANGEQE